MPDSLRAHTRATIVALLVTLAAACAPDRPPAPGERVPDSALEVIDPTASHWTAGDRVALSDLEGRPVLIDFWASWCPPCREQHAHVSEVAERYGDRIAVIGVLVDDSPANALRWMQEQGAVYPTVVEVDDDLTEAFWIRSTGLPHLALVDGNRRLVWHRLGASATGIPDDVLARLDSVLTEGGTGS
jgi:thiol-disulfide isomerase/thioredoxin